jgi:hypothetical protein
MPNPSNRSKLYSLEAIKTHLRKKIADYDEAEDERVEEANEAQENGQYVDAATHLAVAAKKKLVHQTLSKLLERIA